jgi:hypothetical protein
MNLEYIMLCEKSKSEKGTYCMMLRGALNNQSHMDLEKESSVGQALKAWRENCLIDTEFSFTR